MMKAMGKILSPFRVEAHKNNIDNNISQLPIIRPYNTSLRSMALAFAPPNSKYPPQRPLKLCSNFSSNEINIEEEEDVTELESESGMELESVNTNPCIDLLRFLLAVEVNSSYRQKASASSHRYLNQQLLPLAWFHSPLTTLKLIRYLGQTTDYELFYSALLWLHHNHPKTLASNIEPLAGNSGRDFVEIIYRLVLLQLISSQHSNSDDVRCRIRDKTIAIANKAAEMYHRDPDFQFLHDRVSGFFANYLKSDIEKLKSKNKRMNENEDGDDNYIEFSWAAACLPYAGYRAATQLCESIARKLFPRQDGYQGLEEVRPKKKSIEEEADYTSRARSRLTKEVLLPVRRMTCYDTFGGKCRIKQYLEDVKAGRCEIKIDDEPTSLLLLPHRVIHYVDNPDVGDVAQLHWKAMVEDLFNKGKWKNCLAVCNVSKPTSLRGQDVSVAFGLLVSQLSEQPWKGKVVPFARYPDLRLIQGGNDLKSQCAFLRGMDHTETCPFHTVLDLILQEAVNANLKPEQMIKKVLVFTHYGFEISNADGHWPTTYRAIQRKFEEKGYGDAVPHIVFWQLWNKGAAGNCVEPPSRIPGVTILTGYSDNFIKLFLDTEGEVGPKHALESAICDKEYLNLAVVD
ncbi:hypothetical protein ACFX2K_002585 [Malus domestica]